ncbi:MAG: hypothetical protein C5S49_04235 [Candidatus Methanogaster sp.]|nr:MAG: hypothetical protein C5S49_04235 [ANME-2 cluster archaeon]
MTGITTLRSRLPAIPVSRHRAVATLGLWLAQVTDRGVAESGVIAARVV